MTIIDAHMHVWDLGVSDYPWLGPEHGALYRSFAPADAQRELESAGITAAVLVQAENSAADTRYLLDVAKEFRFVAGVVVWVPFEDPGLAAEQLGEYGDHRALCGARHLVHDDPRDNYLELPGVRRSLRLLAEDGLPFDVPDAWPRHLQQVSELANDLPELTVVVDHLGKPPRGSDDLSAWAAALRRVARHPNTVAKVSGLQSARQPFTTAALRPVWELALEAFGPGRLMYGGDWPMTVPEGGYGAHWSVIAALIGELSADEQREILRGTATAVYGIDVSGTARL